MKTRNGHKGVSKKIQNIPYNPNGVFLMTAIVAALAIITLVALGTL